MTQQDVQFHAHVASMEKALENPQLEGDEARLLDARNHFSLAISVVCNMVTLPKQLSTLLEVASRKNTGRREASILTVRALAIDDLLPLEEDHQLGRIAAALIEAGFADGCRNLRLADKRQTFEKINALKGLHETVCKNLSILRELPATLSEIDSLNGDIQRAVRKEQCSAYFQPFGWSSLRGKIIHICEQVNELVACKDATYKSRFDEVSESCRELETLAASPGFLQKEYVSPFVKTVMVALQSLKSEAVDQLACALEPRRKPPLIAEKRYPLHRVNEMLTITVPMLNHGPGLAVDVNVELDCGSSSSLALDTEIVRLGDIPPGEFALSFKAMVVEPANFVNMAVQVSWNELFGEPKSIALTLRLAAQGSMPFRVEGNDLISPWPERTDERADV